MPDDQNEIQEKLRWLVKIRWIGCLGVLVITLLVRFIAGLTFPLLPVYITLGCMAGYNLWFGLKLGKASHTMQSDIIRQVLLDYTVLFTMVVFSGGINSPFLYYFIFHIGISAIILPKPWAYRFAACAMAFVSVIVALQFQGLTPRLAVSEWTVQYEARLSLMIAYTGVFGSTLFFTAYFMTYLAEKLNRSRENVQQLYNLTERLRSTIQTKEVTRILRETVMSLKGVKRIVYMSLDKETFALVYGKDNGPEHKEYEFVMPLSDSNIFTETFWSCVACIHNVDEQSDSELEKRFVSSFLEGAEALAVLPVWASFRNKCYEHFYCAYAECPAFNSSDVRCWNLPSTFCRGKSQFDFLEKKRGCMRCEQFLPEGIFVVDITHPGKNEPGVDFEMLINILDSASLAISNAKLYERTLELSELDGLTGLKNRRSFFTLVKTEFTRMKRYVKSFGIMMIDVDFFKHYNDAHGHPQGDILLKMLADIMRDTLRECDNIGRYGGEEFIVLMPETVKANTVMAAERLRLSVEESRLPFGDTQPGGKLTVSVGVACFPEDGDTLEEIIEAADKCLYEAKRLGRNRVHHTTLRVG